MLISRFRRWVVDRAGVLALDKSSRYCSVPAVSPPYSPNRGQLFFGRKKIEPHRIMDGVRLREPITIIMTRVGRNGLWPARILHPTKGDPP